MSSTQTLGQARRPIWIDAAIALAPVVLASFVGGAVTGPQIGGWYTALVKAPFNPPNWVFGPAWTILFGLMAVSVFRILRLPAGAPGRGRSLALYAGQLALNVLWSCVFFGMQSPLGGILVIVPFWLSILAMILAFRRLDPLAGNLQWPYLAWVSYATLLNVSIWWLNR